MKDIVIYTPERLAETEARRVETVQQAGVEDARTEGCGRLLLLTILVLLSVVIVVSCTAYLL